MNTIPVRTLEPGEPGIEGSSQAISHYLDLIYRETVEAKKAYGSAWDGDIHIPRLVKYVDYLCKVTWDRDTERKVVPESILEVSSVGFAYSSAGHTEYPPEDGLADYQKDQEDYRKYLRSAHWKRVAARAKERAGYRCQLCGAREGDLAQSLQIHHNNYENLGAELDSDVIALCRPCHGRYHNGRR